MATYTTYYETKDGKTRKGKGPAAKPAGKNGAPESSPGADSKKQLPEKTPAKQEHNQ